MRHSVRLNKTPMWCNKKHILLLQNFSTCFGHHSPIIRSIKYWHGSHRYRWLLCQYFILLMMGAWRSKHVEKVCSNKICIFLCHVSVLFNPTKCTFVNLLPHLQDSLYCWLVNKLYRTCTYIRLHEGEPSGSKHLEGIIKIKILV